MNTRWVAGWAVLVANAVAVGQPRPVQSHLEAAARRIMTEPCRMMIRGASHCQRLFTPRVPGAIMRTWDVQWQGRVSQAQYDSIGAEGDLSVAYEPPGVIVQGVTPGDSFSGGEAGVFPASATDFSFQTDVANGEPLLRAFLTDRAAPPAPLSTFYLHPWTVESMEAEVLIKWGGVQPPRLHIATGRLPLGNYQGDLTDRQDFEITPTFPAGVAGQITAPVSPGDGLPAVIVSTSDGFDETGIRVYYGGTRFHRAAGTFQMDLAAVIGFQVSDHLNQYRCTDASLRSWYAATGRPNTFMYLLGHNDENAGVSPELYEQRMRALITRDLQAATSPEVGLAASELRWVLLGPWFGGGPLVDDYATILHHIAGDPPAGIEIGQIGVVSLYDRFGGLNPITGNNGHFQNEGDADRVVGAIWDEFVKACPTCGCYADCNTDGVLNLSDFGCFTTVFALGEPRADCNADGALNLSDFGCFQTKFAFGCP